MAHFKLGTSFDMSIIDIVDEANKKYKGKNRVTELYGSIAQHSALAARPSFRLPDKSLDELKEFIDAANAIGVEVNYTLNSFLPYGGKGEFVRHEKDVMTLIDWLQDAGVGLITVANPMLLEMIKRNGGTSMRIEVSTSAHVDTLTQIKYYHDVYCVSKVCGNLLRNRDFSFIASAVKLTRKLGMQYELMVNEFCGVGGANYATHCIYRDSCYACHATTETYEDMQLLNNYPMSLCTMARNANTANWLRSNFIRPEDVEVYEYETGVECFKITGRTATTAYQKRMLDAYMSGSFDGDLLELWKPLETIKAENESESVGYNVINNKKLDGFIKHWSEGKGFDCSRHVCGDDCNYCQHFYDTHK